MSAPNISFFMRGEHPKQLADIMGRLHHIDERACELARRRRHSKEGAVFIKVLAVNLGIGILDFHPWDFADVGWPRKLSNGSAGAPECQVVLRNYWGEVVGYFAPNQERMMTAVVRERILELRAQRAQELIVSMERELASPAIVQRWTLLGSTTWTRELHRYEGPMEFRISQLGLGPLSRSRFFGEYAHPLLYASHEISDKRVATLLETVWRYRKR